jgi:anti-anti-sigma factor
VISSCHMTMDDLARVHVVLVDDCYVATITGEVDMSNAEELARVLEEQLVREADRHIVDLTGTTYLDSAGVRMLFAISERLQTRGRDLHVVVPEAGPIHRVLLIVDLASRARVHARLEDAFNGDT